MPASTGKARITGLIGAPVTHSLSPMIHEYWLAQAGIDGCYLPFRQTKAELPGLVAGLRQLDLTGFDVTVPYKEAILPYLDRLDPQAEAIGAVNTVVVNAEGRWAGHTTDGAGFLRSLGVLELPAERKVTILGAGGAVRSITHAMMEAGGFALTITNRHGEKAVQLAQELTARYGGRVESCPWETRERALAGCDLLVNGTLLGMEGQPLLELSLDALPAQAAVADIVYAPLETALLKAARERGLQTVGGLGMLLGQAAAAFELWFGIAPEIDETLRQRLIAARGNAA